VSLGLLTELPPASVAAVLAVYLVAGAIKGALGFGLPVVAIAALPFVVPVETALALNAMVILVSNVQQVRAAARLREGLAAAWPMIAGTALMVPVGAAFAAGLDAASLTAALGVLILGFVVFSLAQPQMVIPPRHAVPVGLGMGLASGVVGGLTTAPGPIFVAYVAARGLPRPVYMAALGLIMGSFGAMVSAAFAWAGVLRAEHVALGLVSVVPVLLGMMAGDSLAARLGGRTFRRAVLGMLGVLAALMVERGIG